MTPPAPQRVVGIIPARLGSTRFPGKVLASATGKPLIQHVWESARRARTLTRVVVATDSDDVMRAVERFGGEAVTTRSDHPNGTSRLAEAAERLALPHDAVLANIQGDEPDVDPGAIDAAVEARARVGAEVGTVASPFTPDENPADPNIVKVVLRADGTAMYFSRATIPHVRAGASASVRPLRHVGVYVYSVAFLRTYVALAPTPLECTEMLEQLRVLEHGYRIAVAVRDVRGQGIDTPEQYEAWVRSRRNT